MGDGVRLLVDGVELELHLRRARVKNINARLRGGALHVSAPHAVPARELEAAVLALARRLVRRVRARELNADGHALEVARAVAARFPGRPRVTAVEFVTTQRSRWGSYSGATGAVRLHAALRQMPPWVLEAVVAHELAHAFHLDHSAAFWELLDLVCPANRRARAFLAGVSWVAGRWEEIPPVERALLARCADDAPQTGDGPSANR